VVMNGIYNLKMSYLL